MYAKDLIEILKKLPEDTIICKTSGESGCEDLNSAKYCPQYNILYLEPYWARRSRGFIDMADGDAEFFGENARCPYTQEGLREIRNLAKKGKEIVDAKNDGKMHRIKVMKTDGVFMECNHFALNVDGQWICGHKGKGEPVAVCDFEWESLGSE